MIRNRNPATCDPQDVLDFWFDERSVPYWFENDADFDRRIKERFGPTLAEASRGGLEDWCQTPATMLALIILLDQMTRNIHRGSADAFANDGLARARAEEALAKGFDHEVAVDGRLFFYLPFEHSEHLGDQKRCVSLFEQLGDEKQIDYARRHRAIIARFGRFPHRNALLGRESTDEELAFLATPGSSF